MFPRVAGPDEIPRLAKLWYDAWQDAHADILPEALVRVRTEASFRERLPEMLPHTRVIGAVGAPLGFCTIKNDELYQLFVGALARGTGAAVALIDDAERRLGVAGVRSAWLACAIGNDRAARFYEKRGWQLAREMTSALDTPNGRFDLQVWRYEKKLP